MEKLIDLLNEYDGTPTEWKQIGDKIYFDGLGGNSELHELIIISKYYGFIKWLVDNDKINLLRLDNRIALSEFNKVERVLMALSISDIPIKDLIIILK